MDLLKSFETHVFTHILDLELFHKQSKYQLMMYSPSLLKTLGSIVANKEKESIDVLVHAYKETLLQLLNKPRTIGKDINALTHVYGYFKHQVSSEEQSLFFEHLQKYEEGGAISEFLRFLVELQRKYNNPYLATQTLLNVS